MKSTIIKSLRNYSLIIMILPLTGCDQFMSNYHGLVEFLTNLQQQYQYFLSLIMAFAYVAGALFFSKALFEFKKMGDQSSMMSSQSSLRGPISYMIVGMSLLFLPKMISIATNSVFMTQNVVLSYPGQSIDAYDTLKAAVYGMVQLVGLIAVVRGLFIIANSHQGGHQGGIPKAITHIAGGIIALNIDQFMHILNNEL